MALKILIVGAGVGGPALAMLLQKANPQHAITIVERSRSLRAQGQQVDLKNQAPHILRKMGLLGTVKARCVNETGVEIVNATGKPLAFFGVSASGQQRPGLTSEHEIMRGDLVQVLYDASIQQDEKIRGQLGGKNNGLTYVFGQTITALDQVTNGVDVTFSNDQTDRFDLVVGADGQYSRTRRLAFGSEVSDAAFKSMGIHAAYFSIPRVAEEGSLAKVYLDPGRKMIITRTSDRPITGTLFFTMKDSPQLKASYKQGIDAQKQAFAKQLQETHWQRQRLLAGLEATDDFYATELGQIRMQQLHRGRVVLLGDSGYCPSPFTGLGTNLCLVGAYILAGELSRKSHDVGGALMAYEEKMRPFIDECQWVPSFGYGVFFPSSRLRVWALNNLIWAVSKVTGMFPSSQKENVHETQLIEYAELKLDP